MASESSKVASLRDIAEETGVSIRTVRRALEGTGSTSAEARERVTEVAERLGYRPNLVARALRTGRTMEVGAVLGEVSELHMTKLRAFEERLREAGYSLFVLFGRRDRSGADPTRQVLDRLVQRAPMGVAFFGGLDLDMTEAIRETEAAGLPYMLLDHRGESGDVIGIRREEGVYEAIHYLARSGRRTIAYFGTDDRTRLDGYERAMAELGREPIIVINPEADPADLEPLLALQPRPDALQVSSDVLALKVLAQLHERGIAVPREIAVIGFDDRELTALSWPALTTLAQPNRDVGRTAAEVLLSKMGGDEPPAGGWSQRLPMRLVVRESA
ncbi:MAG: LacI family DNA-binding transcriptional regulator [Lentisphaerae bacterium]|nr:LacI family DNA-binding transcriptional regulator [Lentisphaerota bacterium]